MNKRKIVLLCSLILLALITLCIALKKDAIFQRGNPIRYLTAAIRLSEEKPYVIVDEANGIYISKRGDKEALFQIIQDTYGVDFKDQFGSGYVFSDGEENFLVGSEINWGRYSLDIAQ